MGSRSLLLTMLALLAFVPVPAHAAPRQVRIDDCADASIWSANLGWEFPGAHGDTRGAADPTAGRCLALHYDFSGGGNYVAAMRSIAVGQATEVSFEVRQVGQNGGFVRLRDASGQEHATNFPIQGAGWQRVTLRLTPEVFGGHWSGRNDGKFHFPLDTILIGVSKGPTKTGDLFIKDLTIETEDANSYYGVRVIADGPSNVLFAAGKPLRAFCLVTNHLGEEARLGLRVRVTDWHGRTIAVPNAPVRLAAHASARIPIRLPGDRPEYYRVDAYATAPDGRQTRGSGAVVVVRRPRNFGLDDPSSFFAIQQNTDGARTERLGVKWVRAGMDWRWGELQRGTYVPVSVKGIRANHQRIMYTMTAYPPGWAAEASAGKDFWVGPGCEERIGWWAAYVEHRARELAADVDTFEIQNEPDLTCMWQDGLKFDAGIERYLQVLRAGSAAVRRGAPKSHVAGIDVSGGDYDQGLPFSRAMMAKAADIIDIYTGHPYAGVRYFGPNQEPMWPGRNEERRKCLDTLEMIRKAGGKQRFWIGEKGWGLDVTTDPLSDYSRDFARCLVQSMVTAHSVPGVERYYWFLEEGCNEGGNEYGLFRGGIPMPAALAYSVMADTLHHATPRRSITLAGVVQAHSFRSKDTGFATTVLWSEKGDAVVTLKRMPAGARLLDVAGAAVPAPKTPAWRITVDRSPIYLQVPLAAAARAEAAIAAARVQVASPLALESAYVVDGTTLAARVRNLTDKAIPVSASASGATAHGTAAPLAATVIPLHLARPIAADPSGIRVAVAADGFTGSAVARTDFTPCPRVIPPADGAFGDWLRKGQPIVLDRRQQVLPADPGIGWDGPEDLSARMWVAWDNTALHLLAVVRDDVHVVTTDEPEGYWGGDSLQIGIDPRNDAGRASGYDPDDLELGMAVGKNGAAVLQSVPTIRRLDLRAGGGREGHDTTYRLDMPWSLLGVKPRPGMVLGFNVIVNDNDGQGRAYWMGITPGIGEGKRPSVFKKLRLEE